MFHPTNLPNDKQIDVIFELLKALYGISRKPLRWFIKLVDTVTNVLHYQQLSTDGSVFICKTSVEGETVMVIVLVYVNDLIFTACKSPPICAADYAFRNIFQLNDCGSPNCHLRIKVKPLMTNVSS